ncbi:replicative helicase DnaB-like [[Clostridium] sordellii]|uniref:DNA 5'-3' helicase n=1 Tax=Paraclostridium sordellii TaxID=1505 RepID=A0ABP1XMM1_PARSO|nr:replicative DNA helicase [Paeniclostridium sordellii]CEJ72402.1 putative replicative helicase DnaB-like [[Clostridium] sordellii] [Paeniclostridium sordellii]CEN70628.1 replicative helicase DnaB-like [[Clostridium] sordellii] [Paeniclostridium sordellii]CEN73875.1 replicative helicase DnaB-like [[Clostridium] sordellii] [Paeniclostridium sordellii]CEP77164.1 replicative helicase DnaB-like [[Clostridium] sordellii] [Paeniclostridium sordellii]
MNDNRVSSLINVEAERIVVGTLMTELSTHKKIENIQPSMFSEKISKSIFKVIAYLINNDKPVDIPNIDSVLKSRGINISVSSLTNLALYSNLYSFYGSIEIIRELYLKRYMYEKANRLVNGILEGNNIDKLMYEFEEDTKAMSNNDNYDDSIQAITERLFDRLNSPKAEGVKFNIPVLDRVIGGLYPTELTTIGAKSGVGKTAMALYIANGVLKQNKKVLIITREMTDEHILQRLITQRTAISSKVMKNKDLSEIEWKTIVRILSEFNNYNLNINDKISKPGEIRRRIKELKPDLVIIDYLQLLTSEENTNNREREVASLSRAIKDMAQGFKIPIIQLTQLNDSFTGRPFGESPVRESKAIYQDSNNVIYIHKPTNKKDMEEFTEEENLIKTLLELNIGDGPTKAIEVIISKCRDGGTAIEKMWYEGTTLSYKTWNV